jgi:hypothetical protein
MKLLPEPKLLLVGYIIGTIFNLSKIENIRSLQDFLIWLLIGNTINGITAIIVIRIFFWIGKKVGLAK